MKTLIFFTMFLFISNAIYCQTTSTIVYEIGTNIDVGDGADVCADLITVNGSSSGVGTFCNSAAVDVDELGNEIPAEFSLNQNYPNPFNPTTTIKYEIPKNSFVKIIVYDLLGREINILLNEEKNSGIYEINFDAKDLSSGIYFYSIKAKEFYQSKKMILLK